MKSTAQTASDQPVPGSFVTMEQVVELIQINRQQMLENQQLKALLEETKAQLDWFKKQLFGTKSEKRVIAENPAQMQLALGDLPAVEQPAEPATKPVAAHKRKVRFKDNTAEEAALFFDEDRVPIQIIELSNPETKGLSPADYEIIGTKETFRLAQQPGSYIVLKYVRPVIKLRDSKTIHCPRAPGGVFDNSRADVSLIAGLLIDKLAWHLPLYRQHQRMGAAGIQVSRAWLTTLCSRAADLLSPIHDAQMASIGQSHVITMDETSIKAGRKAPQKMNVGFFWPVYGDQGEICFPYFSSRKHGSVDVVLGSNKRPGTVMLSDGYGAYSSFAARMGMTHAECWIHTRREFLKAEKIEPDRVAEAVAFIQKLYAIEGDIKKSGLTDSRKRAYRIQHATPIVDDFFKWVDTQLHDYTLLPSSPFAKALGYAHRRQQTLRVYLDDPLVPPDTNHIERSIRPVALGRKNWMFAWTELGAKHIGILQGLISTCRVQDIDPYTYLVDVLQRVSQHPASEVHLLTPRLWKEHFATNPLGSPISQTSPVSVV